LRPEFAPAHLHLAEALAALGKFPEAAAQYREALRLQPDVTAQKKLEALLAAHPEIH